jgi:hypothetical protein
MTDRAGKLEAAASLIDNESLDAAKAAIIIVCQEYLCWADRFIRRLETALALTLLGHLPTRPGTCPFCIQYGKSSSCQDCGYAATHGRCECNDSSFSLFIEAFQELGKVIYQDTGQLSCHPDDARQRLNASLRDSSDLARKMMEDLPSTSALLLMERKAWYLDQMIRLLPLELLDQEVTERCRQVQKTLSNYW